jgi:hypothetical protein
VEYIANFMSCDSDPIAWASEREAEGWDVLGCADHLWSSARPFPHMWVTLGAMAASTDRVLLTSSFSNNLLRSPVEFAQASLQMHAISGARFEAGLGAGWSKAEIQGAGLDYPSTSDRAGRYIEAISIVRALIDTGTCNFSGDYYNVDVTTLGPRMPNQPVPLVASLGGPRTIRNISPLVDRVELKLISSATRDGDLDITKLASIPRSHVSDLVAQVRAVNRSVPIGVFLLCGVGSDARTKAMETMLGDSFIGGFFGSAAKVAESMQQLASEGITRIQVSPFTDESFALLAPELFQ